MRITTIFKNFLIIVLITGLSSCASLRIEEVESSLISNPVSSNCQKSLSHSVVTINNAKRGIVRVEDFIIPDFFIFIQDAHNSYRFAYDLEKTPLMGYNKQKRIAILQTNNEISDSELSRGWYLGSSRKSGTPPCWIFVQWNGGSAFIDIERIEKIVEASPFNSIFPLEIKNRNLY
ncbi:MAG: hypothetical protein PF637_05020 [Spirochaetes bacterium]|jgi:hypothetical protein|nr:hypothetical protein [Spirochaetota bacterium]